MAGSKKVSPLLTTPIEVLHEILSHVIGPPSPIPIWIGGPSTSSTIYRSPDLINLLKIKNKVIQNATMKAFYGSHVFGVTNRGAIYQYSPTSPLPSIGGFRFFLSRFPTDDLKFITRLEIEAEIAQSVSKVVPVGTTKMDMNLRVLRNENNRALELIVTNVREKFTGLRKIKVCVHDMDFDRAVTIELGSDNYTAFKKSFDILFHGDMVEEVNIESGGNMDLLIADVLENSPLVQVPTVEKLPSGFFHYHLKHSSLPDVLQAL